MEEEAKETQEAPQEGTSEPAQTQPAENAQPAVQAEVPVLPDKPEGEVSEEPKSAEPTQPSAEAQQGEGQAPAPIENPPAETQQTEESTEPKPEQAQ